MIPGPSRSGWDSRAPNRERRAAGAAHGCPVPGGRAAASGFTLMETLVATMVLSVALVILLQQLSAALNGANASEAYTRAVWHARERMEELLLSDRLTEGEQEGVFDDGYRWRSRVEPAGDGVRWQDGGVVAYSLTVWITWAQGGGTKQLDVAALSLAAPPNP